MLKEDYVQILNQRNWIPRFRLDDPIIHPDAHQCLDYLNSSRLHSFGCHGNTSGRLSEFDK
jgi:hypothetical protein